MDHLSRHINSRFLHRLSIGLLLIGLLVVVIGRCCRRSLCRRSRSRLGSFINGITKDICLPIAKYIEKSSLLPFCGRSAPPTSLHGGPPPHSRRQISRRTASAPGRPRIVPFAPSIAEEQVNLYPGPPLVLQLFTRDRRDENHRTRLLLLPRFFLISRSFMLARISGVTLRDNTAQVSPFSTRFLNFIFHGWLFDGLFFGTLLQQINLKPLHAWL